MATVVAETIFATTGGAETQQSRGGFTTFLDMPLSVDFTHYIMKLLYIFLNLDRYPDSTTYFKKKKYFKVLYNSTGLIVPVAKFSTEY